MKQDELHILAIEDNPADFRLLKELLSENPATDFELTQAQTLKDALSVLVSQSFNVVLLDLNLPDGKGLENIGKLFSSSQILPIIVLTGLDDEKTGIKALEKGAQDYLIKDKIRSDSLVRSIRYAIERKRAETFSQGLNLVNEAVHSTLDLDLIMQKVVDGAAGIVGCDTAAISLRSGGRWKVGYVHGLPKEIIGTEMNDNEERHAFIALETKSPVAINDAFNDERVNQEHMKKWGVRSVLVVPLIAAAAAAAEAEEEKAAAEEELGVIFLNYHKSIFNFNETHIDFAKKLSASVSLGITTARLFERVTRELTERKQREKDLRESRLAALNLMEDAVEARKQAEKATEALRINREDLDCAQAVAQVGSWRLDVQKNELTWSDENYRIFGVPKGTPQTYETFLSIVYPDDREYVDQKWKAGMAGESYDIEHRIIADGKVKWVREKAFLERDPQGRLLGGFGITQDITERRKMEEALQFTQFSVDHAAEMILWIDAQAQICYANEQACRSLGYSLTEFLLKPFYEIDAHLTPEDWPRHWDEVRLYGSFIKETAYRTKNKGDLLVEITINYLKLGALEYKCVFARDITERKKMEAALSQAYDTMEAQVARRTAELVTANKQLNLEIGERQEVEKRIRASNTLLKLLGKSVSRKEYSQSLIGLIIKWSGCRCAGIRIIDEEQRIPYDAYIGFDKKFWKSENGLLLRKDHCACTRAITGIPETEDSTVLTKDGSFRCDNLEEFINGLSQNGKRKFRGICLKSGFKSLTVIPIRHKKKAIAVIHLADERPGMVSLPKIELIERLAPLIGEGIYKFNMEDRIKKDHTTLDAFFEHTVNPLVFMDKDFNFIRVNTAYAKSCQRDASEFPGRSYFEFYPDKENEKIFKKVVKTKTPFQIFAKPFIFPDHPKWGVTYWDWTLVPILDKAGNVELLVFSLNDVTERKNSEEKLRMIREELLQAKRLSDIGTLAATVAHELRNPLAAIHLATHNISRKKQDLPIGRHLENIEKKVFESNQIINNLLFYSRLRTPQYESVEIQALLDECIDAAKMRFYQQKVKVIRELKSLKDVFMELDPLQARELFGNILNNAFDALTGKAGEITIKSEDNGGESIKLHFHDNGSGIDEDTLERIFDPFFTTKAKGTGLGLAVCRQIANLHKGEIVAKSQKNKGTTIIITLPLKRKMEKNV